MEKRGKRKGRKKVRETEKGKEGERGGQKRGRRRRWKGEGESDVESVWRAGFGEIGGRGWEKARLHFHLRRSQTFQ